MGLYLNLKVFQSKLIIYELEWGNYTKRLAHPLIVKYQVNFSQLYVVSYHLAGLINYLAVRGVKFQNVPLST